MKAVKQLLEVNEDKSVTIRSLPFKPGSTVEVIVLPTGEEDIFSLMDKAVKSRKIKPMTLGEIESIVHEVREGR